MSAAHDAVVLDGGYVGAGLKLEGRGWVAVPLRRRGGEARAETNVDNLGRGRLQPFDVTLGGDMGARVGIERPCMSGEEVIDGVHEGVRVGEAGELASCRLLDVDLVSVLPIDRVSALGPIERARRLSSLNFEDMS